MLGMTHQLISLFFLFLFPLRTCNADVTPPNPNFYPSKNFQVSNFRDILEPLWGDDHQYLQGPSDLIMRLDQSSGSGFKSKNSYNTLYIGVEIKAPNTAATSGLDISFYLSSLDDCSGNHDEIDIELLGSVDGTHYHLQTNVIIKDHSTNTAKPGGENNIGREMTFKLWFDPTADFHNYALVKSDKAIIFFVDDIPIRRFPNRRTGAFPNLDTMVYGSIWDASKWATENGKYQVDYSAAPFIAEYRNFQVSGCEGNGCSVTNAGNLGLSTKQKNAMRTVQKNYMIYNYCENPADESLKQECSFHSI